MIRQLFLLSSLASVDAFLTPPAVASPWQSAQQQPMRHPSPLHSDASDGAADEAAEPALPSEDESDILNSPAFLQRKADVLQADIAALEKEMEEVNVVLAAGKAEWGTKFDMLSRESQSMNERMADQSSESTEVATVQVAEKILNVLDNYDRAFQAVEATTNEEMEIAEAYKNTNDMILTAFTELNVTKVETVGVEFDYLQHQAMLQMPSDEHEEGIVCQEFAMGWKCGETLIRPAMVAVAA